MIRLTRSGVVGPESEAALVKAAAEFSDHHCVRLREFIDPELMRTVQRHLARAEFRPKSYHNVGTELCMNSNHLSGLLSLWMNNPRLFRTVERLAGCGRIGNFQGRIYRMLPSRRDHDDWHNDTDLPRLVGVSINLSAEVFSGGVFQLRRRSDDPILCEIANTGLGDAILFRISEELVHRVTLMEGTAAKTAFAGWFFREENTHPLLRAGAQGFLHDGAGQR